VRWSIGKPARHPASKPMKTTAAILQHAAVVKNLKSISKRLACLANGIELDGDSFLSR
jgi:hypothetical protein